MKYSEYSSGFKNCKNVDIESIHAGKYTVKRDFLCSIILSALMLQTKLLPLTLRYSMNRQFPAWE